MIGQSALAQHLILAGLLTERDCQLIMQDQSHTGQKFAKVTIAMGLFTEQGLADFLHKRTGSNKINNLVNDSTYLLGVVNKNNSNVPSYFWYVDHRHRVKKLRHCNQPRTA